ncbi:solute carrier family 2, facilitated glucose transporter member 8-like [Bacillus rossius redtenbacheri]|uniref:solute carrier family 2, facilitated glucose transporter member 8-like n=1 Tax=Bacillus rossius redtenbacheri TaxID=93214 RepID=UPI002FDCE98A
MEEMMCKEAEVRPWSSSRKLPQYLAAFSASLMSFSGGTCLAWASPATPLLQAAGELTAAQASWAGSLLPLGAALGAPVSGWLLPRRGPRGTLLLLGAPFALGYVVLLALHAHPACMYAARLLSGAALGGLCVATPVYLAEISEDSVRGGLGSFLQLMFSSGILFVYLLGLADSYVLLAACCLAVPLASTAVLFWMPESPVHLLARNRRQEATESLRWLRGGRPDLAGELQSLQAGREEGTWRDLVSCPSARKALGISLGLVAFQQLSGICAVLFYAERIFLEAGSPMSPGACSAVTGAVMVVGSCLGSLLADRLGRRVLLLWSGCLLTLTSGLLGGHFLLMEVSLSRLTLAWAPLLGSAVYMVAYCVGLGPLPWVVMAEVLPPRAKGLAGSVCSSFCWLLSFLVAKSFQDLKDAAGTHLAFWVFCFCCFVSVLFVHFVVPETKGKSLRLIQEEMTIK